MKQKHFDTKAQEIARQEYQKKSRDNARTPVQWSAAENAGFTGPGVKPWMSINPDYVRVNAEAEVQDPNSTYHFWAAVLGLRKKHLDTFVYGDYKLVDGSNEEIFAYTRQYNGSGRTSVPHESNLLNKIDPRVENSAGQKALVVCNWTEKDVEWDAAGNGFAKVKDVLLDNYEGSKEAAQRISGDKWPLKPYEAVVVLV